MKHSSKRKLRRQSWKNRKYLNSAIQKKINQNYIWASSTWSGTRCAECGLKTEPRYQVKVEITKKGFHLLAINPVCDRVNFCPGENLNWQNEFC